MAHELTHASFFSGVGGLDLGLERAGWRTVSFSEIDPYARMTIEEVGSAIVALGVEDREEGNWLKATDAIPSIEGEAARRMVKRAFRAGYLLALADSIDVVVAATLGAEE